MKFFQKPTPKPPTAADFTIHLVQHITGPWLARVLGPGGEFHYVTWGDTALLAQDAARAWIALKFPPAESSQCSTSSSPPPSSSSDAPAVPLLIPHPQPHDTTGP